MSISPRCSVLRVTNSQLSIYRGLCHALYRLGDLGYTETPQAIEDAAALKEDAGWDDGDFCLRDRPEDASRRRLGGSMASLAAVVQCALWGAYPTVGGGLSRARVRTW